MNLCKSGQPSNTIVSKHPTVEGFKGCPDLHRFSLGQIDELSAAIRNHAETRALAQQPALAKAINRLQQKFAVVLEQKHRTRSELKHTLSTVQLPIVSQVVEQLQSAIRDLDSQLSPRKNSDKVDRHLFPPLFGATDNYVDEGLSTLSVFLVTQQSVLINQIDKLSDQDFLLLRQQVRAYSDAKPPAPPTQAERHRVSQEISRLDTQINQQQTQHSSLAQAIEQMQKNPFRLSNKKLDEAFAKLKQTSKSIESAMAQKDVCLQQLQQWAVQEPAYLKWSSSPQTAQMRQVASVLKLPMMQKRLSDIQQELQRQAEVRRDQQQGHQRLKGRGR